MSLRDGSGFGHYPFGHFPFGNADFGEDTVVRSFPDEYLFDETSPTKTNDVLLHYLLAIKDSANRVKAQIDRLPNQVDFRKIDSALLVYLGQTISVNLDDAEPDEFRRSLVGGAVQFYRIKGTLQSYRIRGKISGFDVTVRPLYRIDPAYVPLFDISNIFELPFGSGNFYTDLEPGTVPGTPTEASCDYCQTASIKIGFTVVKPQPPAVVGQGNFFDRLIFKLRDIIPIHVTDLLYEIVANIEVDEHQYLLADLSSQEDTFTPASMFAYFDVIAADSMPLDAHGGISGTASLV